MKRIFCGVLVFFSNFALASQETIGPNGIDSAGLLNAAGVPLNGTGVTIGHVELRRSADPTIDFPAASHANVDPAVVFFRQSNTNFNATIEMVPPPPPPAPHPPDIEVDLHALGVAGVMISTAPGTAPATPTGVATGASLLSVGFNPNGTLEAPAVSAKQLITFSNGAVRAINMSFGFGDQSTVADGNSLLSLFVDYSAQKNDVLYVIAGNEMTPSRVPIPTDSFNGIVVASSSRIGTVFRKVSSFNVFEPDDAEGPRTSVHILAPGDDISLTGFGTTTTTDTGTSFSAPHVTGTIALLQQYGQNQAAAGATNWVANNARRHEVMKAVLMNSADKIEDNSGFTHASIPLPVPTNGFLGMQKTIVKYDPMNPASNALNWFDSPAANKDPLTGGLQALDIQMGTGQLNARRALTQYSAGEFGPGRVPVIGWDIATAPNTVGASRAYSFNRTLLEGSFVSITLAYDRTIMLNSDVNGNNNWDAGDTFIPSMDTIVPGIDLFSNLDLELRDSLGNIIAVSEDVSNTVDHIFFQIPATDQYEVRVLRENANAPGIFGYALAWWALGTGPTIVMNGDFNFDEEITGDDIQPMLKALTDLEAYKDQWDLDNTSLLALGDINGDGFVTNLDIQAQLNLIATLEAGAGSLSSVPEPSTWILLAMALPALCYCRFTRRPPPLPPI